jgi:hypothetical protein
MGPVNLTRQEYNILLKLMDGIKKCSDLDACEYAAKARNILTGAVSPCTKTEFLDTAKSFYELWEKDGFPPMLQIALSGEYSGTDKAPILEVRW